MEGESEGEGKRDQAQICAGQAFVNTLYRSLGLAAQRLKQCFIPFINAVPGSSSFSKHFGDKGILAYYACTSQ